MALALTGRLLWRCSEPTRCTMLQRYGDIHPLSCCRLSHRPTCTSAHLHHCPPVHRPPDLNICLRLPIYPLPPVHPPSVHLHSARYSCRASCASTPPQLCIRGASSSTRIGPPALCTRPSWRSSHQQSPRAPLPQRQQQPRAETGAGDMLPPPWPPHLQAGAMRVDLPRCSRCDRCCTTCAW